MPKAVKSEGDCPRYFSHHVHYFPAAPVSPNKRPNRSRWPQEHKGRSFFFHTSNSRMKESNLFIRPLKPGQSWQMCGRKTQRAKEKLWKAVDCKFIRHRSLISQPGMQLLNRFINMLVEGKCPHNLQRLLFLDFLQIHFFPHWCHNEDRKVC